MLNCGNPKNGFATYICLDCGERKRVGFSCKSRVCSSCGKVHADNWAQQLASRMINVIHRHITFTLPSELWRLLEENPEWRKELFGAANETLRQVIKTTPGIVMVLHPYGKDLKANFHLHVLVTEGGVNESGGWKEQSFLNYSRVVFSYVTISKIMSCCHPLLFSKQISKDVLRRLSLLESIMCIENQVFNQSLCLLATRLPNGFDGQTGICR